MIPWNILGEWGQRVAVVTGLATPVYGGLAYLQLTPVTQSYVNEQMGAVRKDISVSRLDTLDTKRLVMTLARNAFAREQEQLETALATERNHTTITLFKARLTTVKAEIAQIDRKAAALDVRLEDMKNE